jgi:hypothetical protein
VESDAAGVPAEPDPAVTQLHPGSSNEPSIDDALDEALEETFPASDPVAVSLSPTRSGT